MGHFERCTCLSDEGVDLLRTWQSFFVTRVGFITFLNLNYEIRIILLISITFDF